MTAGETVEPAMCLKDFRQVRQRQVVSGPRPGPMPETQVSVDAGPLRPLESLPLTTRIGGPGGIEGRTALGFLQRTAIDP
ncbi:hypothetical protein [Streptomyces sp. NPDC001828]|uniref:hypothetical protein n=1 Tax=Streptomyces sp. NPDC001828 TaxID=3364615 RepID=UPI0036897658